MRPGWLAVLCAVLLAGCAGPQLGELNWLSQRRHGGPGPNQFDNRNVWHDEEGRMHLAIVKRGGEWSCAEAVLGQALGFGRYEFEIEKLPDLGADLVLGFFNYPSYGTAIDGTNEIDVEIARWGNPAQPNGNFTVWPADPAFSKQRGHHGFEVPPGDGPVQFRFDWQPNAIDFEVAQGQTVLARWRYAPDNPLAMIPQRPLPVMINYWLFEGRKPKARPPEIVVTAFRYTPRPR
ncbi:glycoside hydrolase family 16 protein [Jeongeupia chitinilytica]|uniref:GH16 domain-containing protein n=1 Tax=Jeongeupia chitinilytica TaxID=1041641 RepID=A0ABQ3H280_9NEIS|nr:glycoside hydrolase family 16 protein [Jeongeupia chitinilytica]GHD64928.1 hypothetical protein GCM10007350_24870 [Jeongeupia chitinilytica]